MSNVRAELLPKREDPEVEGDFISGYEGIVKRIVADTIREFGDFILDYDDLYQEGMIALVHASRKFKTDGTANFVTYAYVAVRNRIIKEMNRYKEIYSNEFYSYSINPAKYERQFVSNEESDYRPIIDSFMKTISRNDAMILTLYLKGKSYAEIAVLMNENVKRIDNRLCAIKKKLYSYYQTIK